MISEAALAAAVVAYLEADGWTAYQEVSLDYKLRGASVVGDGRVDIVVTRDGQLGVVECKGGLTFALLAQAKRWIPYAHMVWIAVPFARDSEGRREAFSIAREHGFGILVVHDTEIRPRGSPTVRMSINDALLRSLRDGHKTSAEAGSNRGGQFTSFKETCEALRRYVTLNPGCKLAEAIAGIKHHYGSKASAESSIRKMMRKGLVPGVYVGWKQGLFSSEEEARTGVARIGGET
jgi:hypothetical protein